MAAATVVFCISCGSAVEQGMRFCPKCGSAQPTFSCPSCGTSVHIPQAFCGSCGTSLAPVSSTLAKISMQPNLSGYSAYYQEEFRRIIHSGESYQGKWNWAAFWFGGIWALTKGLWLPAVVCFVVSIFTGGVGGVVYWFIFAARGNYMYYCKAVKGKDIAI